jgi:hypothetical protein
MKKAPNEKSVRAKAQFNVNSLIKLFHVHFFLDKQRRITKSLPRALAVVVFIIKLDFSLHNAIQDSKSSEL